MARYDIDYFINANTGQFMDFDGQYGAQCVDLFNYYNQQVIGAPFIGTPVTGGAADLWTNFDKSPAVDYYDRIPNTPDGVPQYGDVVIWAANASGVTGPAGHVGIFLNGDVNSLTTFDQNYPTGSPCHAQHHANYKGVYGWLRPKTPVKPVEVVPAPVPAPEPVAPVVETPAPAPAPVETPVAPVEPPVVPVIPDSPLASPPDQSTPAPAPIVEPVKGLTTVSKFLSRKFLLTVLFIVLAVGGAVQNAISAGQALTSIGFIVGLFTVVQGAIDHANATK